MLLDDLHEKKKIIEELAAHYGARRIRVFGSVARREERPDSDIDFLVDFPQGYDLFAQRIPLIKELSDLTGRPVEVIPEHELNQHLSRFILEESMYL
jgi:predicted nucleotidyltransferase